MAFNQSSPNSEQHKSSAPFSITINILIKFSIQFLKEKYGEQFRDFSSYNLRRYLFLFST